MQFGLYLAKLLLAHPERPNMQKRRIACIGDSITYGYGVKGWLKNNYPAQLSKMLDPGYCVHNYGVSGRTASLLGDAPYEKEKTYEKSLEFCPDIVVLMLGTNDSKPHNYRGTQVYREDIIRIINAYQKLKSDPKIYLMTPPPAWGIKGEPVKFEIDAGVIEKEMCPVLKDIARQKGINLIDLYSIMINSGELFPDGVHPGGKGAGVIADIVYKALKEKGNRKYENKC